MGNIASPAAAGGGGGAILLRAEGQAGNRVKATLGGKLVEGTIPDGGVLQLKLPRLGLWEVDTETEDSLYHFQQEVKVYRYGITPCWAIAKKLFADCTPEEIQFIARAKLCEEFGWQVGDQHKITMLDGEETYWQIHGFNHDVAADGETILPLTLGMKDCFKATRNMNGSKTTSGGWTNCNFRQSVLPSLKENFPDEWKKIMTICQKKTSAGNRSSVISTTKEDLFLFSEVEVFGSATNGYSGEGKLYPIFTNNGSRIKHVNGSVSNWWERSPIANLDGYFCSVSPTGTSLNNYADTLCGVALGFCVG